MLNETKCKHLIMMTAYGDDYSQNIKQKGLGIAWHIRKPFDLFKFIVYWQKENTEREVRIVLPELYFEKKLT